MLAVFPMEGQVSPSASTNNSDADVVELPAFQVEATAQTGYDVEYAVSASRIKLSIQQTPVFLQVLTRDLIDDTDSLDMADLTRYVSGVNSAGEVGTVGERFTARGFGAYLIRNGFSQGNEGYITDATTIERVEVAKGPSGVIYGQSTPGGVLNLLSRRASLDGRTEASFVVKAGEHSYYRGELDVRGPLFSQASSDQMQLAYRLVSSYVASEFDLPYLERERFVYMPSLSARFGKRLFVNMEYEVIQQNGKNPGSAPWKTVEDSFGQTTILDDTYNGRGLEAIGLIAGPDTYNDQDQSVFMADINFVLSDSINLRAAYSIRDRDIESIDPIRNNNSFYRNNIRTLNYQERDEGSEGWKFDGLFRYAVGPVRGSLVAGYEFQSITLNRIQNQKRDFAPIPPYSIGNPKTPELPGDYLPGNRTSTALDSGAIFAINTLTFFEERGHLVLGYRNEEAKIYNLLRSRTDSTDTREATYQTGLAFDWTPDITVFANRSTSFLPTAAVDIDGKTLPPEVGEGFDFGLKLSLLEGKLSGTVSYFDLERTNISRFVQTNLPDGTIITTNVPSGTEQSRGVDFELTYSVNRRVDVMASATFFDGEITSDENEPRNNGRPIALAAESTYAIYAKYRFLENWTFGFGYSYKSMIENIDVRFDRRLWNVPEFHQYDVLLQRQLRAFNKDMTLTLSIKNLADRRARINRFEVQEPRRVMLGLKTQF